jgi:hypothetical protein
MSRKINLMKNISISTVGKEFHNLQRNNRKQKNKRQKSRDSEKLR